MKWTKWKSAGCHYVINVLLLGLRLGSLDTALHSLRLHHINQTGGREQNVYRNTASERGWWKVPWMWLSNGAQHRKAVSERKTERESVIRLWILLRLQSEGEKEEERRRDEKKEEERRGEEKRWKERRGEGMRRRKKRRGSVGHPVQQSCSRQDPPYIRLRTWMHLICQWDQNRQ